MRLNICARRVIAWHIERRITTATGRAVIAHHEVNKQTRRGGVLRIADDAEQRRKGNAGRRNNIIRQLKRPALFFVITPIRVSAEPDRRAFLPLQTHGPL